MSSQDSACKHQASNSSLMQCKYKSRLLKSTESIKHILPNKILRGTQCLWNITGSIYMISVLVKVLLMTCYVIIFTNSMSFYSSSFLIVQFKCSIFFFPIYFVSFWERYSKTSHYIDISVFVNFSFSFNHFLAFCL